jgi:hypothetical protein
MTRPRALLAAGLLAACNGTAGKPASDGAPEGSASAFSVALTNTAATATGGLAWVAFQDGDGPWQSVEGAGGVYSFEAPSGRYGLAFVCDLGDFVPGEIVHASVAELPALTTSCNPAAAQGAQHLRGAVRGLAAGGQLSISAGGSSVEVSAPIGAPPPDGYDLELPIDVYDVVGVAFESARPSKALIAHDVSIKGEATLDLDFTRAASLVEQPVTVTGAAGEVSTVVRLTTARGTIAEWLLTPATYAGLRESDLGPDDIQEVTVSASAPSGTTFLERGVVLGVRAPRPLSVTLPPAFWSAKLGMVPGAPYLRPRASFEPYPDAVLYQVMASAATPTGGRGWLVILGAGWLGARKSYDFPDFSGVRGFQARWMLQAQDQAQLELDAVQSSRDLARTIASDHASSAGAKLSYAKAIVVVTP